MFEPLKLEYLSKKKTEVLREPSSTRPAIWVAEDDNAKAVVKDYSVNKLLYRNLVGRLLIWREKKAYRRLRGLEGVPNFFGVADGLALVIEKVPGQSFEGLEKELKLPKSFFDDLRILVKKIHDRGVAHCDLKRAPNILLGDDGKPYIIDWSAAILERECRFFPLNLVYKRFLKDDFNATIKAQLRHCPEALTEEQKRAYFRRNRLERLIRRVRDLLREFLQKIA
ncbi:MAG: hypothetical protein JRI79_00770 [Deltaproteobacteria bacterium]|nr:hypothetical protein [Deltaproteobacteria bacterium]MBW1919856.1 hypothetical protein [Deltaproteobacteria bacterium]MBW1934211.1 hypothetical protein [Deltaproteobacteria bacterium]MBW1976490.1 hypothetical protein [Deltaproteobacteria bacterium]MBW2046474.1 hypothetical protein [Deltaproteobacteria bacterium]